ncbi:MAG: transporter substrate-binding domain-containing protein [Prevotella sp.]|nr:transporter substrate-binding domain-containing protein [Prevotella sp.]
MNLRHIIASLTCLLLTLTGHPAGANAAKPTGRDYSEQHPLVFVASPDRWPYSFKNDDGTADGYEIDLMRILMDRLGIPFIVRLAPLDMKFSDIRDGKADLTIRAVIDSIDFAYKSKEPVYLFTHSLVVPRNMQSITIRTPHDIAMQKVFVWRNSYAHKYLIKNRLDANCVPVDDVAATLRNMNNGAQGLMLINSMTQKWFMEKNKLDRLKAIPIYMPTAENVFVTRDSSLMAAIDSTMASLPDEELRPLRIKWFFPDKRQTGIPAWVWQVAEVMVALLLLLTIFQIVTRIREKHLANQLQHSNNRLSLILKSSHMQFLLYDVATNSIMTANTQGHVSKSLDQIEFSHQFVLSDFERMHNIIQHMAEGKRDEGRLIMRQRNDNSQTDNAAQKQETSPKAYNIMQVKLGVLRRDKTSGLPTTIIITMRNVTEEQQLRLHSKDLLRRSQIIFNTALNDMIYFDAQGRVTEMNERATRTFGIRNVKGFIASQPIYSQMLETDDCADVTHGFHAVTTIHFDTNAALAPHTTHTGDMLFEMMFTPVYDASGQLQCYFVSGANISETARSYRAQQVTLLKMEEANNNQARYTSNIKEVLQMGGLRIINYSPDTHSLSVMRHDDTIMHSLSQVHCISLLKDESRDKCIRLFNQMDRRRKRPIDTFLDTSLRDATGLPLCLQVHLVPLLDEQGQVTSYYGLFRDVSRQMAIERTMKKEMAKAQETEQLKTAFLKNMSYQIRTPLNAVIGFTELFAQEHDPADEAVFVAEIKKNSDYLLRLINSILYLSRLNAHMVELQPKTIDMAECFDIHTQIGWNINLKQGVKTELEQPFRHLVLQADEHAMTFIIEKLAANAAKFTTYGRLKASLAYIGGQLMMTFDDTGQGIRPDDMAAIHSGDIGNGHDTETELDLAICVQLAQLMGGHINIESELEQGTTIMVTLPIAASQAERRKEV